MRFSLIAAMMIIQFHEMISWQPAIHLDSTNLYIVLSSSSSIILKGSTNVNNFNCSCQINNPNIESEITLHYPKIIFNKTNLAIKTNSINCNNHMYNENVRQLLNVVEYPEIKLVLLEAYPEDEVLKNKDANWKSVKAKVKLTIKSTSAEEMISARFIELPNHQIELKGSHKIQLHQFNIVPPKYLLGLIEIDDQMSIEFDYKFHVTKT